MTVNASESIQLIGRSADGDPSGLFAQQNTKEATGNAGNLEIKTGELVVRDGAEVGASTFGAGNAGNLTVTADESIQVIGSARSADDEDASGLVALARSGSTGDAGNLNIKTGELVVRDGARVSASTFAAGKGGSLTVTADESIKVIDTTDSENPTGLFAQGNSQATGDAGDLQINTNLLLIEEGGVFVGNRGKGNAGSLNIDANSIRLDDNAIITANTRSPNKDPNNPQANINIRSQDLILSDGSNITANARGENVIGGNINIDTGVLAGFENSDITANSTDDRGGNVVINAEGVFGIQFRDQLSPLSDITATGANSELSGNVDINTPESDPTGGLVQLPANTVDASNQIFDPCTPGNRGFGNSFVSIGRGGLPMTPTEPLQDTSTISTWVKLKPQPASRTNRKATNRKTSSQPTRTAKAPKVEKPNEVEKPIQIVEATGWIVDEDGNIEFVAQANHTNPKSPWQNPASCSVSQ